MVKTAFNIKYRPQIESGAYEVVTREARHVDIIKWDLKGDFPVVGVYYDEKNDRETAVQVTAEGRCSTHPTEDYCDDFFIITDESELTEFEGELKTIVNTFSSCRDFMNDEGARNIGKTLLDAARKEIEKEMPTWKSGTPSKKGWWLARIDKDGFASIARVYFPNDEWPYKDEDNVLYMDMADLCKLPKEDCI